MRDAGAEMTCVRLAKAWLVLQRGNRRLALRHKTLQILVPVGVGAM